MIIKVKFYRSLVVFHSAPITARSFVIIRGWFNHRGQNLGLTTTYLENKNLTTAAMKTNNVVHQTIVK